MDMPNPESVGDTNAIHRELNTLLSIESSHFGELLYPLSRFAAVPVARQVDDGSTVENYSERVLSYQVTHFPGTAKWFSETSLLRNYS